VLTDEYVESHSGRLPTEHDLTTHWKSLWDRVSNFGIQYPTGDIYVLKSDIEGWEGTVVKRYQWSDLLGEIHRLASPKFLKSQSAGHVIPSDDDIDEDESDE
jgi:hypothetical protein